ncbi:MAG: AMP-binding protein, partial [Duncaniella sp.]|nr:AMP-binding protein [Duncaniella sp.]
PKEIRLAKNDMLQSALSTVEFFGLDTSSVLLLPLSPGYIAGKMQIVRALAAGCRLVAESPSSRPFATTDHLTCSLIPLVPSQIEGFLSSPTALHTANVIIGGAPMSAEQEKMLLERGMTAYATYGMTETCSHVALRRVGEKDYHALPGVRLTTADDGCLSISRQGSTWGSVTTTDIVEMTGVDTFRWKGRRDNVINSGGVKIHPETIEEALMPLLPAGTTAYVTGRASSMWGEEAVIVTDAPAPQAMTLIERLRPLVARHHLPKDIITVPVIERTDTGKIKRLRF